MSRPTVAEHPNGVDEAPPSRRQRSWRRLFRPAVLLVSGGLALYVLLPSVLSVFGSWRSLSHLDWPFATLTLGSDLLALSASGSSTGSPWARTTAWL
jgi:hypothetical protein